MPENLFQVFLAKGLMLVKDNPSSPSIRASFLLYKMGVGVICEGSADECIARAIDYPSPAEVDAAFTRAGKSKRGDQG